MQTYYLLLLWNSDLTGCPVFLSGNWSVEPLRFNYGFDVRKHQQKEVTDSSEVVSLSCWEPLGYYHI